MTVFTFDCPACGHISDYTIDDPNLPQGCPKCTNREGPGFLVKKFGIKVPEKIVYELGEDHLSDKLLKNLKKRFG